MTHDDAIKSLLRAKGLIDPLRIARAQRARVWNERQFPQHTGRTINVPCEIVEEPTPAGSEAGANRPTHVEH